MGAERSVVAADQNTRMQTGRDVIGADARIRQTNMINPITDYYFTRHDNGRVDHIIVRIRRTYQLHAVFCGIDSWNNFLA